MFFEGSEKKVEVVVKAGGRSLRDLGKPFWEVIVAESQATILSTLSNEVCDAYLLSESSLFVWEDRFLMLTCGTTTLVNAITKFLESYGRDNVTMVVFQRKNEYQSHLQKTCVEDDIEALEQFISGTAYRLGHLDAHHNYVYHLNNHFEPDADDFTAELLMYHISGPVADYLRSEGQTAEGIRSRLQLSELLPGFTIDDFVFEPYGYSLNAIKDGYYATFHITPQERSSYVSFETNLDVEHEHAELFDRILAIFQPKSYDVISFDITPALTVPDKVVCISHYEQPLACGYQMTFRHFLEVVTEPAVAERII
ncbi:adenosylmethionine decarboxylase [Pokkaliibacter plantistimulans]|uniref:Adenosylmethionine decarboxylase n=1 Tax=Pokkaliibacter plantistimulans TaxID=1635171 RepID=A0ABX5M2P5_9GAMM|nr:adenosylmethionine decarboxylase [Pokkaliibacter plantistimulans]PXF33177.1 adenosylmethionine decarboxylase [Pokkaliibacter plantistimulans]